ncbi:hypothetical protein ACU61A_37315 [Pseudonocardia sichuanensis]|uniref:Uncharacterized protein n=1 Tax=Pseudonocardia kunmingensis TaxID=630975 RepID=A0A543D9I1_9PSEU|nr:hypothetical protein [Pseudonocardia kunmingensis]TQM06001.1 hypothetical protein FB558_6231 [Pseudonocardia kunmingensis]
MPRAPRTLLLRLTIETAKRTRKCSRSKSHAVRPGERLLLVGERGPAAGKKGYCAACAAEMLAAARDEIDAIRSSVQPTPADAAPPTPE